MKKIKWEHILLFFLELLVNMATVGVAILLNALIDAAQISITSQDAHHLQKVLFISILYACLLYTSPSPRDVEESRMPSSA